MDEQTGDFVVVSDQVEEMLERLKDEQLWDPRAMEDLRSEVSKVEQFSMMTGSRAQPGE